MFIKTVPRYRYRHNTPTFSEFVNYILDLADTNGTESLDPHFRPQWQTCPHCMLRFDAIGKLEHFNEDSNVIMQHLGIQVK